MDKDILTSSNSAPIKERLYRQNKAKEFAEMLGYPVSNMNTHILKIIEKNNLDINLINIYKNYFVKIELFCTFT